MRVRAMQTLSDIPSPSSLLGTSGSARLIESINESLGASGFASDHDDRFSHITESFIRNVVQPAREMHSKIISTTQQIMNIDEIRLLSTLDDFKSVPPCMRLGILTYEPVRALLKQGRISGWGFDEENLPDGDDTGRLLANGYVDDILLAAQNQETVPLVWNVTSDDPDYSEEEIDALRETRRMIDEIMESSLVDITDPDTEIG